PMVGHSTEGPDRASKRPRPAAEGGGPATAPSKSVGRLGGGEARPPQRRAHPAAGPFSGGGRLLRPAPGGVGQGVGAPVGFQERDQDPREREDDQVPPLPIAAPTSRRRRRCRDPQRARPDRQSRWTPRSARQRRLVSASRERDSRSRRRLRLAVAGGLVPRDR